MPAYLQPALGSGVGITDYRSHCQVHASLAKDLQSSNERDLREKMMGDPSGANNLRLRYVQVTPYFETDKCWSTQNPPVEFPHYDPKL
jgi:hypothetical protein